MNIRPLTKNGITESEQNRTPSERLLPAREALLKAARLLEQFAETTNHVYDGLTERDLLIICKASEMALNAAENAANLGWAGYEVKPVEPVSWRDEP